MSIEVTMRHSDVRIESLKEYAELRMQKLAAKFPKVTTISIVIDVDAKKHMYMAEVVANRLGETAVGAKEFSGARGAAAAEDAREGAQGDCAQAARGVGEELNCGSCCAWRACRQRTPRGA